MVNSGTTLLSTVVVEVPIEKLPVGIPSVILAKEGDSYWGRWVVVFESEEDQQEKNK